MNKPLLIIIKDVLCKIFLYYWPVLFKKPRLLLDFTTLFYNSVRTVQFCTVYYPVNNHFSLSLTLVIIFKVYDAHRHIILSCYHAVRHSHEVLGAASLSTCTSQNFTFRAFFLPILVLLQEGYAHERQRLLFHSIIPIRLGKLT
jgi:hypothetical protein